MWRGTIKCEPTDDISTWDFAVFRDPELWKKHGQQVGEALQYIPGSFDRPPRNIAEKISSGYKAKEWQGWLFGLAPALLYNVLPYKYWKNFVKYVRAFRLLHQYKIPTAQLIYAHRLLCTFHREFEEFYYQRRVDRLHFVRPCIHAVLHICPEVQRIGPLGYSSQWTLERTIGNLGEEIKQPSNPFKNLSQRALRRAQVNALKVLIPRLEPDAPQFPRGSSDASNGYVLLRARDRRPVCIGDDESRVIREKMAELLGGSTSHNGKLKIVRWARLRLPNGQIARSTWKEKLKEPGKLRMARCNTTEFAEVLFYFKFKIGEDIRVFALVILFSPPDRALLEDSEWTVWSAVHLGVEGLRVVEVETIQASVSMQPHDHHVEADKSDERWFVWEQCGLEIGILGGYTEKEDEEDAAEAEQDAVADGAS
ncbi:hypothetical protein C8R44DRAFT_613768 [Mycena epipterygia]|nr:hypothetical protein C8R44DRAFT_613768 [Mycena epipterygia]